MFNFDFARAIQDFAIAFVPAYLGIVLHELGHGYAAYKLGDPTAKFLGRLTLNPLPHIDITGLLVFIVTSISGSFVFGWAKPVPVSVNNLREPKKDMMLVSLAGPITNLLLALFFAGLLKLLIFFLPPYMSELSSTELFLFSTCKAGILINIGLACLNMLPIPPLDGSKVLAYFLPNRMAWSFMDAGRYGFLILMVLVVSGLLGRILGPILLGVFKLILMLFGLI